MQKIVLYLSHEKRSSCVQDTVLIVRVSTDEVKLKNHVHSPLLPTCGKQTYIMIMACDLSK